MHFRSTVKQHDSLSLQRRYRVVLRLGADSITPTVKSLVQEKRISSPRRSPLPVSNLLMSHREDFLKEHLARVPVTPNQQGTMGMRDEAFSRIGAQDMDTSGYQVSDLEDNKFHWEDPGFNMDTKFRPGIGTPFSSSTSNDFEMGSMAENLILIDEEQDNENDLPFPNAPISERPPQPPVLMRSHPSRTRTEIVPDHIFKNLFE